MELSFDGLLLGLLTTFLALFAARTVHLRITSGVRVITLIRGKPVAEKAVEVLFLAVFPAWVADVAWHAWPGTVALTPQIFSPAGSRWLGAPLCVAGVALFAWALASFGRSWRVGVDRESPGGLVTSGAFSISRNPIFFAMDLFIIGTALMTGRVVPLAVALIAVPAFHRQILNEERFLDGHYGEAYRRYCERVGRYLGRRNPELSPTRHAPRQEPA